MPLETESITANGVEEIYSWDEDDPENTRKLVFIKRHDDRIIEWFSRDDDFPIRPVIFEGFRGIPPELAEAGYIKGPLGYHLSRKITERSIEELTISRDAEAYIRKIPNAGYRVVIPYTDFSTLAARFRGITSEAQTDRRILADTAFHGLFPSKFEASEASLRRRLTRLLNGLDEAVIGEMSADEINRIFDFTKAILENRYEMAHKRHELFTAAKLRVDSVALSEVIAKFEALLAEGVSEAKWGEFLRKNLFLVESRYIHVIDQLNVVLGGSRNVDFGLVDAQGYLDLFEIKLPTTRLIAANMDRGNYYWHADAVKAIVQAEKYLHNADRQAPALAEAVRRQRGVEVRVVRPRAVVVMGTWEQLDDEDKANDFRVLRTSLKNVEIVLYDELLERLRNQQNKVYV